MRISEVFKDTGQPDITYVLRESGNHERRLAEALNSGGALCLITGPSKTGKTTLYNRVLKDIKKIPIVVRCDNRVSSDEIWRRALESAGATRPIQSEAGFTVGASAGASLEFGWKWIASVVSKFDASISGEGSEKEIKERILSAASPFHLIPLLRQDRCLILEDFHYLRLDVQTTVFQQWKTFVDERVPIVLVGTTHHANDLARANKDLVGRIQQIDVAQWTNEDLRKIVSQGMSYLNVRLEPEVGEFIASESVGLPIITQQVCAQLFFDKDLYASENIAKLRPINKQNAVIALNNVALRRYQQLEEYYNILTTGPRKKARKYETYELVLSCFATDPLSFKLRRHEIDERLVMLPGANDTISLPPAPSINAMLGALERFQRAKGIELLEWRASERVLYILEPAFLFFLRWRLIRSGQTERNAWEQLLIDVRHAQLKRTSKDQLTFEFIMKLTEQTRAMTEEYRDTVTIINAFQPIGLVTVDIDNKDSGEK